MIVIRKYVNLLRNSRFARKPIEKHISNSRKYSQITGLSNLTSDGKVSEEWKNRIATEKILKSPLSEVAIPNISFPEFLFAQMEKHSDNTMFIDGVTGQKMSYRNVLQRCLRVSSALIRRGLVPGDCVAIHSFNDIDYFVAWLATIAVGGVVSNVNPTYTAGELKRHFDQTEPVFVFTHPMCASTAVEVFRESPTIKEVIVFGEFERCVPFCELTSDDGSLFVGPHPVPQPKQTLAFLASSSGTTGLPKLVCHSHKALMAVAMSADDKLLSTIEPEDIGLLVLPFYHVFPIFKILVDIRRGSSLVLLPNFNPDVFLKSIQDYKVTNMPIVPPLGLFMLQHPMVAEYDLSSLKAVAFGAAAISEKLLIRFKTHFKIDDVRQGYGLTETGAVAIPLLNTEDLASVGVPIHNSDIKIVDTETGSLLGPNEKGEICYRGPSRMMGYLNNPEATKETIDIDEWLHTGDVGYYSKDGNIFISDRIKDMVKYKGHQVAPAELEALLITHSAVKEAAVIGIPDDRAGEVCRAFVVLQDDCETKTIKKEIAEFIANKTAPEKHLHGGVFIVDDIPKSPAGKMIKKELRNIKT